MANKLDWEEVRAKVLSGDVGTFYGTARWKRKRKEILKRDHNQCQRCLMKYKPKEGSVPKLERAVTVHHNIPLRQDFSKALVNENLISLCFQCHEDIEGRAGWKDAAKKKPISVEMW